MAVFCNDVMRLNHLGECGFSLCPQDFLCMLRMSRSGRVHSLLHSRNTQYGQLVRRYQTGFLTMKEPPRCARLTRDSGSKRKFLTCFGLSLTRKWESGNLVPDHLGYDNFECLSVQGGSSRSASLSLLTAHKSEPAGQCIVLKNRPGKKAFWKNITTIPRFRS